MPKIVLSTKDTSAWPEFAGNTWVSLQYMLGFAELGVDCAWVDALGPIDPLRYPHSLDYLLARFEQTAREFGFADRYGVIYNQGERYAGMTQARLRALAKDADLLISVSGHLPPEPAFMDIPRRAYLDVDPGFTQIWAHEWDMGFARHTLFLTTGQNVGRAAFSIPTNGVRWQPMLPPVALGAWPYRFDERCRRFSTVADWRGSQEATFQGEAYSGKRDEFLRVLRVGQESGQRMEIALCIGQHDHEDLGLLDRHEWRIRDPYAFAGDPHSYREFIQYSRAEFSVAKAGYLKSKSGWVSDRTACYLASGKPALVQSTGFEPHLPTGKGLLTFRTPEEAVAGIKAINADYAGHCQAARQLAERYFSAEVVLGSLLKQAGL